MTSNCLQVVECNLCGSRSDRHVWIMRSRLQRSCQPFFDGLKKADFRICSECGLVFISPRPREEFFLEFYRKENRSRQEPERIDEELQKSRQYHEQLLRFVEKSIHLPENAAFLDYGCGYGGFLDLLVKKYQANGTGVELSDQAVMFCRSRYSFQVVQGTIENVQDRDFDLIVCVAVLEHLPDPKWLLQKMRQRLRANGFLLVVVPDVENLSLNPLRGGRLQTVFKIVHLYYFSLQTLTCMLESCGFKVLVSRKESRNNRQGELWVISRKVAVESRVKTGYLHDWKSSFSRLRKKTFLARCFATLEGGLLTVWKYFQKIRPSISGSSRS